jgi:hypothetical protein
VVIIAHTMVIYTQEKETKKKSFRGAIEKKVGSIHMLFISMYFSDFV